MRWRVAVASAFGLSLLGASTARVALDDEATHVCTVEAQRLGERVNSGKVQSPESAEEARAKATRKACSALGFGPDCVDEGKAAVVAASSSFNFSFSTDKGKREGGYSATVSLAPIEARGEASAKARSPSQACAAARDRACKELFPDKRGCTGAGRRWTHLK